MPGAHDRRTERAPLHAGFHFGVATAGFQIEGGYNGPGEPANNWSEWEELGRVEPSGIAIDFWNRYEDLLDRAEAAGCDSFRMSVEWARCEPAEGRVDAEAFERYARILGACRERSLMPLVTLHHFTHPAWLGPDFWLGDGAPKRFAAWATSALERLHDHCDTWITINEPSILSLMTYVNAMFPPGRIAHVRDAMRCFDHLMAAHVLAYDAIHAVQPEATVSVNDFCFSVYELQRMAVDVLLARSHGVARGALPRWLTDRRRDYYATIDAQAPPGRFERLLRAFCGRALPISRSFGSTVDALYAGEHDRPLDNVQIDFYNPVTSSHLRVPGHRSAGGRNWLPGRLLWDDFADPEAFVTYCTANHEPGMELWVVENGMCNRVRRGRSWPRLDGLDRPRFIDAYLDALPRILSNGVRLGGYWHWTLADNYEWGSYEPRFGLHGVDRERGAMVLATDAMGYDAAGAYRSAIEALRAGGA